MIFSPAHAIKFNVPSSIAPAYGELSCLLKQR
jgi:hypothetical protein